MKTKMVIAVRRDLNMSCGRISAQVAHAAMRVWFDRMELSQSGTSYETLILPQPMIEWKEKGFTKVVVWVDNDKELLILSNEAKELKIPYAIMVDDNFPKGKEATCIAIGPDIVNKIDKITEGLELI